MAEAGSWTRHKPTPDEDDASVCAVCGQPILTTRRAGGIVALHKPRDFEPVRFNGERGKKLYEALEASLLDVQLGPQLLAEALSTIHRWNTDRDMWNVVRRWCHDHGEDLS